MAAAMQQFAYGAGDEQFIRIHAPTESRCGVACGAVSWWRFSGEGPVASAESF